MEYRTLGRTGLRVSLAALGTGGPSKLGQSAGLSATQSHRIVHAALDLGINILDTSPVYGDSEDLLGGALATVARDRYVLCTKFATSQAEDAPRDPADLTRQLDRSLQRLGLDYVDVLQYHGVTAAAYRTIVDTYHEAALRAQEAGKIRFIGITETVSDDPEHEMLPLALKDDLFDVTMVRYGILNQLAERQVFPVILERNVGVLVMAPVRLSLRQPEEAVSRLKGFITEGLLDIAEPSLSDPLGLGQAGPVLRSTEAAYQFAAAHPAVSTVLIGTGNVDHLRTNVTDMLSGTLTPAQIAYLHKTYGRLAWNA